MKIEDFKRKDILGLRGVSREEISFILEEAQNLKTLIMSPTKNATYLRGRNVCLFFMENSTRTKLSFETACKYLSATSSTISKSGSSVNKGENLYDTVRTIEQMGTDIIVMRHPQSGAAQYVADHVSAHVINAGDGMNEHPTQALLDMLTVYEYKGGLDGLKVAIIGDLQHSRVLRSNLWGMTTMGAEVYAYGPPTMMPWRLEETQAHVCKDIREALDQADIVMGLRVQLERQKSALFPSVREYLHCFGVDEKLLQLAKPDALIMHPGPCNRGVEMTTQVHDHERSVIEEQVTNGVAVRMALLRILGFKPNMHLKDSIEAKGKVFGRDIVIGQMPVIQ